MYKCRVCQKKFNDLFIHLHKDEEKLLMEKPKSLSLDRRDVKPDHLSEYDKIENSIDWLRGSEEKCFCGGKIVAHSYVNRNYISVEVSCEKCGFLWDED